jgi:hypothetical protein
MSNLARETATMRTELAQLLAETETQVKTVERRRPKHSHEQKVYDTLLPSAATLVKSLRRDFDTEAYGAMLTCLTDWQDKGSNTSGDLSQLNELINGARGSGLNPLLTLIGHIASIKAVASAMCAGRVDWRPPSDRGRPPPGRDGGGADLRFENFILIS